MPQLMAMTRSELMEAEAIHARICEDKVVIINGTQARLTYPGLVAMGALPALGQPYGSEESWRRGERVFAWVCGAVVAASLGLIGHALVRLWL